MLEFFEGERGTVERAGESDPSFPAGKTGPFGEKPTCGAGDETF